MNETIERKECQICERKIGAKTGVIAHHGYTRPNQNGYGYQTESCAGARELPYEKSCDLIPPYIASLIGFKADLEKKIKSHRTAPPKVLIIKHFDRNGVATSEDRHDRPAGFSLDRALDTSHYWGYGTNYPYFYKRQLNQMNDALKDTNEQIKRLTDRVENWIAK